MTTDPTPVALAHGSVAYYAAFLRSIAFGSDSAKAWAVTEGTALDLIENAVTDLHSDDARRLTEARNVLAALATVKAEREARLRQSAPAPAPESRRCDGYCSGQWEDPDCSWHGRPRRPR